MKKSALCILLALLIMLCSCGEKRTVQTDYIYESGTYFAETESKKSEKSKKDKKAESKKTAVSSENEQIKDEPGQKTAVSKKTVSTKSTSAASKAKYEKTDISFEVPQPSGKEKLYASDFGMDTKKEDNTAAFLSAVNELKIHDGATLYIEKGVYKFCPSDRIVISNIDNCIIDGGGSEFLFANGKYFDISACDTLRIQNLNINWDWEKGERLASLVKVRKIEGNTVTLEFTEVKDASFAEKVPFNTINQFDPTLLSPGLIGGKEFGLNANVTAVKHISGNLVEMTYNNAASLTVGEIYLLRHYVYESSVFYIYNFSKNITLRDINIYSARGCGITAGGRSEYMLFERVNIGLKKGTENEYRVSTTADAFHIADTRGHFIMDCCDVSFQGDDALNVHDNVGVVTENNGKTIVIEHAKWNFKAGVTVGFLNRESYRDLSVFATVATKKQVGKVITLTFDKDVSSVPVGSVIYETDTDSGNYIVRNCYFHENRARGLLLGASNALVENNKFYRVQYSGIKIGIDIGNSWMEGRGVDNITVRNNEFAFCNTKNKAPLIQFEAKYYDADIDGILFNSISITNNTFSEFPGELMNVFDCGNLTFKNNTVVNDTEFGTSPLRGKINADRFINLKITDNVFKKSKYMNESVCDITVKNQTYKKYLTVSNNVCR